MFMNPQFVFLAFYTIYINTTDIAISEAVDYTIRDQT